MKMKEESMYKIQVNKMDLDAKHIDPRAYLENNGFHTPIIISPDVYLTMTVGNLDVPGITVLGRGITCKP